MRKAVTKYILLTIVTIALVAMALFGVLTWTSSRDNQTFSFVSEHNSADVAFYPHQVDGGHYVVFLPSYMTIDQLVFSIPEDTTLLLGGTPVWHGTDCGDLGLELEKEYEILFNRTSAVLQFYQSANVGTMHLNTVSGSMKNVDADKKHEEYASISLYNAEGELDCAQEMCTIKGRGNWTWTQSKKPYSLTLNVADDLLGMGESTDWVLLANAADETNLRNKLVFDLANHVGLGAPQCRFVDLYLNGEYNGLYLLTETVKKSVEPFMVNRNDFLCKIELNERWATLNNPILTEQGRTVAVELPKVFYEGQESIIRDYVNELEDLLMSPDVDLSQQNRIDLDSWVHRYLMDEISGNIDADLASSYFYFTDGRFVAGPVWDYDVSFGNSSRNFDAQSFVAQSLYKGGYDSPYYHFLYQNESFFKRMIDVYQTTYLPLLEQMTHSEIPLLAESISASSRMNSLRWQGMYQNFYANGTQIETSADTMVEYIRTRTEFLNRAWVEHVEFRTVCFLNGNSVTLEKGTRLPDSYAAGDARWVNYETDEPFDITQPIVEDVVLINQAEPPAVVETATQVYVVYACIAVMLLLFAVLVFVDVRRNL